MFITLSFLHSQQEAYNLGQNVSPSLDVRNVNPGQILSSSSYTGDIKGYFDQHKAEKQHFKIDPVDPMLVNAEQAAMDPHKTMGHFVSQDIVSGPINKLVTCEQSGEEYVQRCEKHLEINLEVRPATYKTERYCNGHSCGGGSSEYRDLHSNDSRSLSYHPDYTYPYANNTPRFVEVWSDRNDSGGGGSYTSYCNPGCQSRTVLDQPKSVIVTREEWINGCQTLESLADQGLCQCIASEIGPKEIRTISDEPIERSSWFEKYIYQCLKKSADNCGALAARGCVQVSSKCKERIGDVCVLYTQTYRCVGGKKKGSSYRSSGDKTPFCLTGNCADDSYEDNGDFLEALSQLSVLKQVQDDYRSRLSIFTGQIRACRKHAIGFSDCCTTGGGNPAGKGWGQSWGLAGCNTDERELAEWRSQRKCVLVGTYCAEREKITKICLRKKTSFCCFGTKLSRLIQEQGRAQLGIGWGTPREPDCRGLTPDELSRMDMSRMDLSELFADVAKSFQPPQKDHMAQGLELEKIRENMKNLIDNLKKPEERKPS